MAGLGRVVEDAVIGAMAGEECGSVWALALRRMCGEVGGGGSGC